MAGRVARRKIARYVADKLESGAKAADVLKEVAAYLTETRRVREYELIVRDIEDILAERGVVVADITSAHPLDDETRRNVEKMINGRQVQLRETIDETVLGGIRIDVPGKRFDGTIRHKLNALQAKQL